MPNFRVLRSPAFLVLFTSFAACAMEQQMFADVRDTGGDARGDVADVRLDSMDATDGSADGADGRGDAMDASDERDGTGDGSDASDANEVVDVRCVMCGTICTDSQTDIQNCGGCGMICPAGINAGPGCAAGRCTLACFTGFGNCDMSTANGCETNTRTSLTHCGMCGNVCAGAMNGTPNCTFGMCGLTCIAGFGNCDLLMANGCETDIARDPNNCGLCGRPCAMAANATPTCTSSLCGIACNMGFGNCDALVTNGCEADLNTNPLNCGACARRCAVAPNATATCALGACGIACVAGFSNCDGNGLNGCEAATNTDINNCGTCGTVCPSRASATTTCALGACGFTCTAGFGNCNAMATDGCEVDLRTSNANCGACGVTCSAPANATAACTASACVITCNAGYVLSGMVCVRASPTLVAPASTSASTSRRPVFRVNLPSGQDGFEIDICADRACTSVASTTSATASSLVATIDLLPGTYFWRARGRIGAMTVTASTIAWPFYVTALSTPGSTTSWGSVFDPNGDRYADALIGSPGLNRSQMHYGGAPGISTIASAFPAGLTGTGAAVASAGDVNGDGYADAIVGATTSNLAYIHHGGAAGLSTAVNATLTGAAASSFGSTVSAAGDVDGNGYGDVIVGAFRTNRAIVYLGSPTGITVAAPMTLSAPAGASNFGVSVAGACDINADGYADVLVGTDGSDAAYVYQGSSTGLPSTPTATIMAPAGASGFGRAIACAGDVNADGFPEVVIGAYASATAYVYIGSAAGLGAAPATTLSVAGGALQFGFAVAGAGDVNRDGFCDVIVGAPMANNAYIFHGAMAGIAAMPTTTLVGTSGAYGTAVAGAGDTNNDGFWDVIVGAPTTPRAVAYRGSAAGIAVATAITIAGAVGSQLGAAVATRCVGASAHRST